MKKSDGTDFDDWFDTLQMHVLDLTGVSFTDREGAMRDYEDDKSMFDVADEIAMEYGEDE